MAAASDKTATQTISGVKKYKSGGLIDYTGLAQVDGTPGKPESFLDAKATAQLREFMKDLDQMSQQSINVASTVDIGNIGMISHVNAMDLTDAMKGIMTAPVSQNQSMTWTGDFKMEVNGANDYREIMRQAQNDPKFEKMIEEMTFSRALGKGRLSKYTVHW